MTELPEALEVRRNAFKPLGRCSRREVLRAAHRSDRAAVADTRRALEEAELTGLPSETAAKFLASARAHTELADALRAHAWTLKPLRLGRDGERPLA